MQFKQAGKFIINKLSKELPSYLTYHSVEHVLDVYNATGIIGKSEKVSVYEMKLLQTAAWYHDAGFLKGAKDHEEESCRIAKDTLPGYDYSPIEIERICGMIMATKLPQSPNNHLEEIIADADLDYLGRDDFFTNGDKLFNEFRVSGVLNTEEEWNQLQVRFLESHHFFTPTAIKSRQAEKQKHLLQVKAKLQCV
jgi:uncharacterized protein